MEKAEYLLLIEEIERHNRLYYEACAPEISDYEYDQLLKRLEAIENLHPEWVSESSPTKKVAESPSSGFKQGKHTSPMLSLANTYSPEEVGDFIKRVYKGLEKENVLFAVELKMDGTAVSVRYEKGKLVRALTRGNGRVGDEVTANIKTISSLPHELQAPYPPSLEIRGEVYMPLARFAQLNREKEEAGEEGFANPRNAAAGSLKLLDSKAVEKRHLQFVAYAIAEGGEELTQTETRKTLHQLGLPAFSEEQVATCHSLEEIFSFAHKIEKLRNELPFEIDGIVIKLDRLSDRDILGATGKSPRWAVAYKFAPQQARTTIRDITVQVGRTGVLTPVAELEPTLLAGSRISRATLHNEEEIKRKDIRVGDTVIIEKGGDVIPKVVQVDLAYRPSHSLPWRMPAICPICSTPAIREEGEVALRCPSKSCPGKNLRRLRFFASKEAMDIEHLGVKAIEKLWELGLVRAIPDIYRLRAEHLSLLEGFKEKSIENLLSSIEHSKKVTLPRFLLAMGIPHVGEGTAELIAERAGNLDAVRLLSKEQLLSIEGIGEVVADAVIAFFGDPYHQKEIEELQELGVTPQPLTRQIQNDHPFAGKTFVLTGTLSSYTRSEATERIKERGGKVSSSISKATDYLLYGEEAGSKLAKAEKLGVKLMSESDFKSAL